VWWHANALRPCTESEDESKDGDPMTIKIRPTQNSIKMNSPNPNQKNQPEFLDELEILVTKRLAGHLSEFQLHESADGLMLTGLSKSFHAKQMAQELVTEFGNFRIVANELVVQPFGNEAKRERQDTL